VTAICPICFGRMPKDFMWWSTMMRSSAMCFTFLAT
jgi:hypothetical protein